MKTIVFHQRSFEQFSDWSRDNKKLFERLRRMISEVAKNPFDGIGKPEPLKADLKRLLVVPHQRRASPRL